MWLQPYVGAGGVAVSLFFLNSFGTSKRGLRSAVYVEGLTHWLTIMVVACGNQSLVQRRHVEA